MSSAPQPPLPYDFRRNMRVLCAERGLRLLDIARQARIPYDRLLKLVAGQRRPRPEELRQIVGAIARLSRGRQ